MPAECSAGRVGSSTTGIEDAVQQALTRASKTVGDHEAAEARGGGMDGGGGQGGNTRGAGGPGRTGPLTWATVQVLEKLRELAR